MPTLNINNDDIRLNSSSSDKVVVNGNLGIGTTSPNAKLEVISANLGGTAGDQTLQALFSTNNGNGSYLEVKDVRTATGADWTFAGKRIQMRIDSTYMGYIQFNGNSNNYGISFGTGGTTSAPGDVTERMRITSAGNVGIGTTAPEGKLHVSGGQVVLKGGGATDQQIVYNYAREYVNGIYNSSGHFRLQDNSLGGTVYQWDGSSFCFPNGNVGIGTTSPGAKLHLSGSGATELRITSTTANTNSFLSFYENSLAAWGIDAGQANGSFFIKDLYNSATRLTINASGNVGIGTTSPNTKLHLWTGTTGNSIEALRLTSSYAGTGDGPLLRFTNYLSYATNPNAGEYNLAGIRAFDFASAWGGGLQFLTAIDTNGGGNLTAAMTITSAQNVGIGTTSPSDILHVHKSGANTRMIVGNNANYDQYIYFQGNNDWSIGIDASNSNAFTLSNYSTIGTNDRITVTTTGNVGIGTTAPGAKLHILGSGLMATIQNSSAGTNEYSQLEFAAGNRRGYIWLGNENTSAWAGAGGLNIYTSNGNMDFWTSGTQRVRIDTSGNVGIGTTSPANNLHVYGASGSTIAIDAAGANNSGLQYKTGGSLSAAITYVPSTTQLHFYNGGDVMVVGTSNVGIGTTAPTTKLHVSGGDGIIRNAFIGEVPTYGVNYSQFSHTSRAGAAEYSFLSGNAGDTYVNSANGQPIYFRHNNNQNVVFTSDGKVGIGTTAPQSIFEVAQSTPTISITSTIAIESTTNNQTLSQFIFYKHYGLAQGAKIAMLQSGGTASYSQAHLAFFTNDGSGGWSAPSERMRIKDNGNVGIGTTDPGTKLDVAGVTRSGAFLTNDATTTSIPIDTGGSKAYFDASNINGPAITLRADSIGRTIRMYDGNSSVAAIDANSGGLYIGTNSSHAIRFAPNASEAMRIAVGGNVGIGTTSPAEKLAVVGNIRSAGNVIASVGLGYSNYISMRHDDNNGYITITRTVYDGNLILEPFANVGISTTSPAKKLHVYNAGPNQGLRVSNLDGVNMDVLSGANGGIVGTYSNHPLSFYTNSTERITVTAAGNVGIGTASPSEKLHVDGNVIVTYNNSYQGINSIGNKAILARVSPTTGIINYAEYATAANLNGFVLGSDDARVKGNIATDSLEFITNTSTRAVIDSSGNFGIGITSPTVRLHVLGSAFVDNGFFYMSNQFPIVWGSSVSVEGDSSAGSLSLKTASTTRIFINSSGNVGIGTSSPSYRVDISGDARILSGSLGVGVAPNATDGRIDASNDIVAFSTSDQRLKENVTPIENALEKVKTLTGVEFDWKEETAHVHGYHGHDVGIIAQDVKSVLPEAVRTNDSGYLSVRYEKMIALLIEAMKEQQNQIDELKAKLDGLTK